MNEILITIKSISHFTFMCLLFVMLYLSIKKCFLKNKKIRPVHIITILLTNPLIMFSLSAGLFIIIYTVSLRSKGYDLKYIESYMENMSFSSGITFSLMTGFVYILLVLLFSYLVGKKLEAAHISLVTYIYLMFAILLALSDSDSTTKSTFGSGSAVLLYSLDILNYLALIAALLLIYMLVVKELAKMSDDNILINRKLFVIPPVIFLLFYFPTDYCLYDFAGAEATMVSQFFSVIVLFLFIWAFFIITKNINATNEAITAKNDIKTLSVEVMEALANTIDAKDKYTNGHSIRVAKYSRMMAEKMGLESDACENIYYMGLLHDIGKIGVPNEIINKPSRLDDKEYNIIKTHPGIGYDILSKIKSKPELMRGARWHHERFDGRGYPDKLSGKDIPLESRIIAVADAYDAMTSNRSYRQYLPQDTVRAEIAKNSGTQFDPEITEYMLMIIDEDKEYVLHE